LDAYSCATIAPKNSLIRNRRSWALQAWPKEGQNLETKDVQNEKAAT